MGNDKLAADEARREAQHEQVKSQVEGEVNTEIAGRVKEPTAVDAARIDEVAGEFRNRAVDETVAAERELERARGAARVSQVIDYAFYVIYALLATRLVLGLIAARSGAGFVRFIRAATDPLYGPFRGIVPSPSAEGGFTLALPIVIAIGAYALLHAGINGLLRVVAHRKTQI